MQTLPDLTDFRHPREVREGMTNLFPSENSLKWFVRQHRRELADAGAAILVAERLLLHPERFHAVVLSVGMQRAGAGLPTEDSRDE